MLKHIVMFKLKPESGGHSAAENARLAAEKSKMLGGIPSLIRFDAVINSPDAPENNCEFALVCDFDDISGLNAYQVHPLHVEFGKFITPLRDMRSCIDYEY